MDSHPEQIALRPKEFFCSYDIEVLTEMQVRRVLCMPEGKCRYAKTSFRECGRCLCSWLSGCHCRNVVSPPASHFVPHSSGCLWLFKTQLMQFSCGRKDTLGMIMVWPSVVTIICYLPFLMWIWGTRGHLIRIISLQTVQTMMA